MKNCTIVLIALLVTVAAYTQTTTIDTAVASANLKSSAQKMGELFIAKNYTEYVKYIHPKTVKMAGGRDNMIALIKKSLKQVEDEGLTFQNVTIGDPSAIIITNTGLQSVIPQVLEMKTKSGRLEATSYLIATSSDKGKTWYFIDTGGKTLEDMKTQFPFLSNELIIPEKKSPVFFHD